MDNGGCSHNCSTIPGEGFMCSCPLGMELGHDNKTCQIQSFCAKHLKCSQKCEQEKSSVKCSCYEGWELEADMESCKSTGEDKQKISHSCILSMKLDYLDRNYGTEKLTLLFLQMSSNLSSSFPIDMRSGELTFTRESSVCLFQA